MDGQRRNQLKTTTPGIKIQLWHRVCIFGMTGSGKSVLMKKLLSGMDYIVVYDTMHEHEIKGASYCDTVEGVKNALQKRFKKIVYRPKQLGNPDDFEAFCWYVYSAGNYFLFIDEAHIVMPNNAIGDNAKILVSMGRKRGVGICMISQRPASLDKLPVSQSQHIFIFKSVLPGDIKFFREFIGDDAEKASNLPKYHFLYFDGEKTIVHKPV